MSWDSSVITVTRLRAGREGFSSRQGKWLNFFYSLTRPDRLWGVSSLLYNGYWQLFPREKGGQGVKLITRIHLVPRLITRRFIPPLPNTPLWRGAYLSTVEMLPLPLYKRQNQTVVNISS